MKDNASVFKKSAEYWPYIIMPAVEQLSFYLSTKAKNFSEIYLEPISMVVDTFGYR